MLRHSAEIEASSQLKHVRYEIRGKLARRAHELERQGYEIIQLNIGNPGLFGLRTPETMRLAMIENLRAGRGLLQPERHLPGARGRRDAAAGARRRGRRRRPRLHGQRRQRAHRSHAARAAEPRRRSADPEPRLSAVDGSDCAQRRPRGVLPVPRVAGLHPRSRRRREADHAAHARASSSSIRTTRPAPSTAATARPRSRSSPSGTTSSS